MPRSTSDLEHASETMTDSTPPTPASASLRAGELWTPDQPLRADAGKREMLARLAWLKRNGCLEVPEVALAREFAAACVAVAPGAPAPSGEAVVENTSPILPFPEGFDPHTRTYAASRDATRSGAPVAPTGLRESRFEEVQREVASFMTRLANLGTPFADRVSPEYFKVPEDKRALWLIAVDAIAQLNRLSAEYLNAAPQAAGRAEPTREQVEALPHYNADGGVCRDQNCDGSGGRAFLRRDEVLALFPTPSTPERP